MSSSSSERKEGDDDDFFSRLQRRSVFHLSPLKGRDPDPASYQRGEMDYTELGKRVVPRLRELALRGQREPGGGIHAT